jgi:hypothetical protein
MYHLQRTFRLAPWIRLAAWLSAIPLATSAVHCPAADWTDTRQAGSFVCRADFSLAAYKDLLGELTGLQTDLTRELGIPAASEAIEVYLFHDQATYARYLQRYLPGVPYRRALYVKGRGPGRVFAYRGDQFEIDLRHECTHALLHAGLPEVPLWLDEGLAVYFQVPAKERAYDNPHLDALRQDARRGTVPSLEALEKASGLADMRLAEYRGSWAWVHFMLHGPTAAHDELTAYLAGLSGKSPPVGTASPLPPLSSRLRQCMPDVQQRFLDHFQTWRR